MDKKTLVIVCIVMLVAGYFLYDYRTQAILDKMNTKEEVAQEKKDSIAIVEEVSPFNSAMEASINEFIAEKKKTNSGDAKQLYFVEITKENDKNYIRLWMDYRFDTNKVKQFARIDRDIIIYGGNASNVEQNLIKESLLSTAVNEIAYYADQTDNTVKSGDWKYEITDAETLKLVTKSK